MEWTTLLFEPSSNTSRRADWITEAMECASVSLAYFQASPHACVGLSTHI